MSAPRFYVRWLFAFALAAGLLAGAVGVANHGAPEAILPVTKGAYRLPFVNGTDVRISRDHIDHNPHNRLDLSPTASGAHNIVAAGDGACFYNGWVLGGTIENNSIFWRQVTDSIGNSGNSFVVENGAGAAIRAQNGEVRLTPGFRAASGSFFVGSIGACDSPGL